MMKFEKLTENGWIVVPIEEQKELSEGDMIRYSVDGKYRTWAIGKSDSNSITMTEVISH